MPARVSWEEPREGGSCVRSSLGASRVWAQPIRQLRPALSRMIAMGYPKRLLTEGEEIVREFRPHWRMLVIPLGWTLLLGAGAVLTWIFPPAQEGFHWGVTGIAAVAWLVLGLYPLISWFFTL